MVTPHQVLEAYDLSPRTSTQAAELYACMTRACILAKDKSADSRYAFGVVMTLGNYGKTHHINRKDY